MPDGKKTKNEAKKQKIRGSPPTRASELSKLGTRSGYLKKQDDYGKGWTKQFCVIKPSTFLYFYSDESEKYPQGVVDLEYYTNITKRVQDDGYGESEDDDEDNSPHRRKRSSGSSSSRRRRSKRRTQRSTPGFRIAAGEKYSHLKLRPLYFELDEDEEENSDDVLNTWILQLKNDRFKKVAEKYSDSSKRLQKAENLISQHTRKMSDMSKRSKELVSIGMSLNCDIKQRKGESLTTDDHYEAIEPQLDASSSLEKMKRILDDFERRFDMQDEEIREAQKIIKEGLEKSPQEKEDHARFIYEIEELTEKNKSLMKEIEESERSKQLFSDELQQLKITLSSTSWKEGYSGQRVEPVSPSYSTPSKETTISEDDCDSVDENAYSKTSFDMTINDHYGSLSSKEIDRMKVAKKTRESENSSSSTTSSGRRLPSQVGKAVAACKLMKSRFNNMRSKQSMEDTVRNSDRTPHVSISCARASSEKDLPPDWIKKESRSQPGMHYYVHRITKETSWDFPGRSSSTSDDSGSEEDPYDDSEEEIESQRESNRAILAAKEKLKKVQAFSRNFRRNREKPETVDAARHRF